MGFARSDVIDGSHPSEVRRRMKAMRTADSRKGVMDLAAIYHFIFETYAGIGCLVVAGIVISIIAAVLGERKTRKVYRDRGERGSDENAAESEDE